MMAVGAVGIAERFPRTVESEENRVWYFLVFHPAVISTALRGPSRRSCQALHAVTSDISFRLARCMSIAASVSVWARA